MSAFEQFSELKFFEPNISKRILAGFIDYLLIIRGSFFYLSTLLDNQMTMEIIL